MMYQIAPAQLPRTERERDAMATQISRGSALAALLIATACTTPEPEPCTSDWVEWKKDEVFSDFTTQHRSEMRTLRNLEDDLDNPGVFAAIRLASHAQSIGDMANTFIDDTVPDLRASLEPCLASPLNAADLMGDLLLQQGVDPDVVDWVQALGAFMETAASDTGNSID